MDHSRTLDVHDNWVTTEDPGFVDFEGGDFSLRPDDPVFRRIPRFKPVPFNRMGVGAGARRGAR